MKRTKKDNSRWVKGVKTDSTHPPPGTFTKDARTVARIMARKDVSPGGLGSEIRMIQYFINRGGKGLSATRKHELERAIAILQKRQEKQKPHSKKQ